MHYQVTKCLQIRNIYSYDCLHDVMKMHTLLLTHPKIKEGYIMGRSLLILVKLKCACVHACVHTCVGMRVCVCVCVCVYVYDGESDTDVKM